MSLGSNLIQELTQLQAIVKPPLTISPHLPLTVAIAQMSQLRVSCALVISCGASKLDSKFIERGVGCGV